MCGNKTYGLIHSYKRTLLQPAPRIVWHRNSRYIISTQTLSVAAVQRTSMWSDFGYVVSTSKNFLICSLEGHITLPNITTTINYLFYHGRMGQMIVLKCIVSQYWLWMWNKKNPITGILLYSRIIQQRNYRMNTDLGGTFVKGKTDSWRYFYPFTIWAPFVLVVSDFFIQSLKICAIIKLLGTEKTVIEVC
jgi:hypothetical protein